MRPLEGTSDCGCAHGGAADVAQRVIRGVCLALNVAVPGLGGLWLASHGQVLDLAMGLGLAAILPLAWKYLAVRPTAFFTGRLTDPAGTANVRLVMGGAFLSALWQFAILGSWAFGCFVLFGRDPRPGDEPVLMVWAYGTVMAPLTLLAPPRLDLGNPRTFPLFHALGACLLCGFGFLAGKMDEAVWLLAALTVVAAIASSALVARNTQMHRRARAASAESFSPAPGQPRKARRATKRARRDSNPQPSVPKTSTQDRHPRSQ